MLLQLFSFVGGGRERVQFKHDLVFRSYDRYAFITILFSFIEWLGGTDPLLLALKLALISCCQAVVSVSENQHTENDTNDYTCALHNRCLCRS